MLVTGSVWHCSLIRVGTDKKELSYRDSIKKSAKRQGGNNAGADVGSVWKLQNMLSTYKRLFKH